MSSEVSVIPNTLRNTMIIESRIGNASVPIVISFTHHAATESRFELDCSRFDCIAPSPSFASSSRCNLSSSQAGSHSKRDMIKGWGSNLSRSRCIRNLSSLGSRSSSESIPISPPLAGPNEGWGYYVDTPTV